MTTRLIVRIGHPALRAKAQTVETFDHALAKLIADMWETMYAANGAGLAAPQIGESVRVLVAKHKDQKVALVNPEIIETGPEVLLGTEGCLSIPLFIGDNIPRAAEVTIKARNADGTAIELHADGWFARVLQHEIDHLDGILYIDRLKTLADLHISVPRPLEDELAVIASKLETLQPVTSPTTHEDEQALATPPIAIAPADQSKHSRSESDRPRSQPNKRRSKIESGNRSRSSAVAKAKSVNSPKTTKTRGQ